PMPSRLPSMKLVLLLLLPCMLALGIWLGGHPRFLVDPVADVLVGPQERRITLEALDTIEDKYYRKVDRGELSDAALAGAVKDLDDRFSAYLSPKEFGQFEQSLDNAFSGVGTAIIGVENGLRIVTVYPDSPAKRAGLRVGDVVTHANGRKLAGLAEQAATALIKGPEGTSVTLTLRRGKRTFKRRLIRERIDVPVVESRIANAGGTRAAYIALSSFGPRAAHVQMADAIRRQKRRGAKGIVFDLRGNGGGLVTEAQLIASMFLADGTIVTTRGRAVKTQTLEAVGQPIAGKLPTVVLVDRNTASASEIVAGALQDRKRAKLVGVRTFGKGVFQQIMPLENGGALDITVGQYFLPSGRNLGGAGTKSGSGLKPDVVVRNDTKAEGDEQLKRALDVLAGEL
ncbi:MAG: carboxyl-terminal processing protease, partial [Solirubrobacteraceae bacterium]|nr:carboxyl-terminal processing protease [Solirubrobacteraceae bacterium]